LYSNLKETGGLPFGYKKILIMRKRVRGNPVFNTRKLPGALLAGTFGKVENEI